MKKRLLAGLLTLAMLLTMAPVAFAADDLDNVAERANESVENAVAKIDNQGYATLQEALDAVKTGETVEILTDVDLGNTAAKLYTSKNKATNVTVDLGGHTLTCAASATFTVAATNWTIQNGIIKNTYPKSVSTGGAINVPSSSTVTLTGGKNGLKIESIGNGIAIRINNGKADVTVEDGVEIKGEYGAYLYGSPRGYNSKYTGKTALTVNGGTIEGSTAGIAVWGPYKTNTSASATLTVNGGTISSATGFGIAGTGEADYLGDTINIAGGTITSTKDVAIYHPEAGNISVTGGTISGVTGGVQMCSGSLNVTGGTITATGNDETSGKTGDGSIPDGAAVSVVNRSYPGGTPSATISGGTLTSASGVDAVQAYTWTNDAKADWADAASNVSITGGMFSNPATAIEYAAEGATIELAQDLDLAQTLVVKDKKVTLDLNGHKIYNSTDLWDNRPNDWSLVSVRGTGDLTITGNGTLQAKANDCYAADVQDGATLTVENGKLVGNIHAVYVEKGTANIKGGTYSIQQTYPDASKAYEFVLNLYDANRENGTAKMIVTGGTFVKFNPSNCQAEGVNTNFCAPGYKAELSNGVYVVKAGTNDAMNAIDAALAAIESDPNITDKDTKDKIDAALDAISDIPNDKLTDTTTLDKLAKLDDALDKDSTTDVDVSVTNNVNDVFTKITERNASLSADSTVEEEQQIVITVAKDETNQSAVEDAIKKATSADTVDVQALNISMTKDGTQIQPSAPVVLTFKLPQDKVNAKIYRIEDDGTATEIKTTVNTTDGTISAVFEHFSTYGVSYQAATANMNTYQVTLTPRPADVSAGDTITYDVALKHTGGDNAKIGMFRIVPKAPAGLTDQTISLATVSGGQSLITGHDNDANEDYIAFNDSGAGKELAVGDSMNVGTITYKVGDCGNDGAKVVVTGTATLNNAEKQYQLNVDFVVPQEVTYHEIEVTFQQDSATSKKMYARYNTSDLYDSIADMISGTTTTAPALNSSMGGTEYRLRNTDWYEWIAPTGNTYNANSTVFKTNVTYVTNKVNLVEIVLPTEPTTVTVNETADCPLTEREGKTFVDEGADLNFTVGKNETIGEKYEVVVKTGETQIPSDKITWTTNNDGTITGEVDGDAITDKVTFVITSVLDLSEDDIYIFTDESDPSDPAFIEYSAYSQNDTLVLIQGRDNANYTLNDGCPLIYKTSGYAGIETGKNYNYAVLIPKTDTVSKTAILEALTKTYGLHVTSTENPNLDDTTQFLEWDTNGNMDNSKYDWSDVQATKDFARTDTLEWENGPSDGLLLLANVKTYNSATGTYTMERDGHIDSYDIDTFLYSHAGFPRPQG